MRVRRAAANEVWTERRGVLRGHAMNPLGAT